MQTEDDCELDPGHYPTTPNSHSTEQHLVDPISKFVAYIAIVECCFHIVNDLDTTM